MKKMTATFCLFLVWIVHANAVSITELKERVLPADTPCLPHIEAGQPSWNELSSIWEETNEDIRVKAQAAVSAGALHLQLEVSDPEHLNKNEGQHLWRGDSVYVSLDAFGDTTDEEIANNTYGLDDALFLFGLGAKGAECRLLKHGNSLQPGADLSGLIQSIKRDEERQLTTYELIFPWKMWGSKNRLAFPLGIAIRVAHKNKNQADSPWGDIAASKKGTRKLHYFLTPPSADETPVILPRKLRIVEQEDAVQVVLAVGGRTSTSVSALIGNYEKTLELPTQTGLRRYLIEVPDHQIGETNNRLNVRVRSASGIISETFDLLSPAVVMNELETRINHLLETAENDVAREHLNSILRIVGMTYQNLPMIMSNHPEAIREFVDITNLLLQKLPEDRFDWQRHLRKGLPFVITFVNERDYTLQFSMLQLPYNWDPDKAYPLVVYLHGMVQKDSMMSGLSTAFDNSHQDTLFTYEDIDPDHIPPSHQCYVLWPWARGNGWYRNHAEDDVWQSIDLVKQQFNVNEEKQYMTGFSMGCSGAWALAARTPDRWAGIGLASGYGPWSELCLDYLAENAKGIPLLLWVGEKEDDMLDTAKSFHQDLKSAGHNIKLVIGENLPHTYPYQHFQNTVEHLLQFSRPKVRQFTFVADKWQHSGRKGIAMIVDRMNGREGFAEISCTINGNIVELESKNTSALRVQLGEDGLGLTGDVTVIWNGKEAYKGPAKKIGLGENIPDWL